MNIQIGKLYQVNCNYDLIPDPSWKPANHKISSYRKDTFIIPIECQTEDGNENKLAIKVLTQNGKIGWLLCMRNKLNKHLILFSSPVNK